MFKNTTMTFYVYLAFAGYIIFLLITGVKVTFLEFLCIMIWCSLTAIFFKLQEIVIEVNKVVNNVYYGFVNLFDKDKQ